MSSKLNLYGMKFGRWSVVGLDDTRSSSGKTKWICVCACGTKRSVVGSNLLRGISGSCGCLLSEVTTIRNKKHGMSHTKEYRAWQSMFTRTSTLASDTNNIRNYSMRGIGICSRWNSFENFYEDMGDRPSGRHSIDRIDNNGEYSPDNCRWATPTQQMNNTRQNVRIELDGITMTLKQWADHLGVSYRLVYCRFRRGWTAKDALYVPKKKGIYE